jgi:tetratricopeptide (TPR) repeat protein
MKSTRVLFCGLFTLLIAGNFAFAQTASGPVINRPDSIESEGSLGYWSHMDGQGRAGGFLLGKVVVAGDPMPWNPVFVYVTCQGKTAYATYSGPKGAFSISAVNIAGALSLQDDAKRQMETHLEGCLVRASLAGFQSNTITIEHRNLRDDPDLGTLSLIRDEKIAGAAVSATTASAPEKALKDYAKARADVVDSNTDSAQQELQDAVEIDPNFAEAWYQLGKLQQTSEPDKARKSYAAAIAADPHFLLPYEQLAALAVHDGNWKEVADNTGRALLLDPTGTPVTWYYDALSNFELGNIDVAQASAMRSMEMDPQHAIPNTEQLLAAILARKKDYASAIEHLQNCLKYSTTEKHTDELKRSIAKLEELQAAPAR